MTVTNPQQEVNFEKRAVVASPKDVLNETPGTGSLAEQPKAVLKNGNLLEGKGKANKKKGKGKAQEDAAETCGCLIF